MALASLIVVNYSSSNLLYQYRNSAFKQNISSDTKLVASKARVLKAKIGSRQRLNCDYGAWLLTRGEQDLLYAVCVTQDYPERLAFGLISKVQQLIKEKSKQGEIERTIKRSQSQLGTLCEKYKDPRIDKVRQAQDEVRSLRDEIEKGVRKVFQNQDNLDTLNEKTKLMTNYAKSFEKTATVVERKACCKKYKTFLLIGVIIGSVLIFCGLILYARLH